MSALHAWYVHMGTATGLPLSKKRTGLAARFTQLVGTPPLGYLTRLRMQKATTLLRDGATLAKASSLTGYASRPRSAMRFASGPVSRPARGAGYLGARSAPRDTPRTALSTSRSAPRSSRK